MKYEITAPQERRYLEALTLQSPADLLRKWMEKAASALLRAEKRIMENFRVPPGGG